MLAALGLGAGAALLLLRWRPFRVEIEGDSMMPTLRPGDWALAARPRRIRRGDVVVIEHPERPGFEMVKRVIAIAGDPVGGRVLAPGEVWVQGDHPARSTDSRTFGPVSGNAVRATVRLIYWPPERRRWLGGEATAPGSRARAANLAANRGAGDAEPDRSPGR
ncbi:MAG TPA: signal peptidase I [Longimicrobiales bacterium]|nr:signal peptidase I [Longimicrobiales bacterium]